MRIFHKPILTSTSTPQPEARRHRAKLGWPKLSLDLSQPAQRRKAIVMLLALAVIATGLGFAAIQGYSYVESTEFCGTLCHSMDPQFSQHDVSAHSNVECARCHVGPGIEHFVRSKMSGMRQLFVTVNNSFDRPIKSPVQDLRPARETCETCHNPQTFRDNVIKTIIHYDNDKENTKFQTTLLLRMGGKENANGFGQDIHWHVGGEVYYIAEDDQRQVISWVGVKQPDGSIKEYFASDKLNINRQAFVETARAEGRVRTMDCIDCHNRTGHYSPTPEETVDKAITVGRLTTALPFIRAKAVDLLKQKFETSASANEAIDGLAAYYKQDYPTENSDKVAAAITEIKSLYSSTNFPEMKLYWDTNPNNERHTASSGCFRCHDNKHITVDKAGNKVGAIGVECNTCHTVPMSTRGNEINVDTPIIGGAAPATHTDFSWTIEHRTTTEMQKQECYQCHGQKSCNNGVCHNVSHPENMLFSHATKYQKSGAQACYTCHQDVLCSRCHTATSAKLP